MLNPNIGLLSIEFQPKEVYNQTKARFICIPIYLKEKLYRIEYMFMIRCHYLVVGGG